MWKCFLLPFLCFCFTSILVEAQGKAGKPNFIIILADDLGCADLRITGSQQIKTPHIDRLGQYGSVFTHGDVSSAVCALSWAGLLTGRNKVEFGFENNIGGNQPSFDPHIESDYKTQQKGTYLSDDKGGECVNFIKRNRAKPFFLFASFNVPHAQCMPRKRFKVKTVHGTFLVWNGQQGV